MAPLLGKKAANEADILETSRTKIITLIDDFVKILAVGDVMEEFTTKDLKGKEVHRTKAQLREWENKKTREITRAFKAVMQKEKWGPHVSNLYKAASYWLEKMSPFFTKKQDKTLVEAVRPIPFKLAGLMFLLGDYYKACNIMKTCLLLDPGNLVVRSLLFRWSVFLGEAQIVEARCEEEKKFQKKYIEKGLAKERLQRIAKICSLYVDFYRASITNGSTDKPIEQILVELSESEARKENTFAAVEVESLIFYVVSHFGKTSQATETTYDSLWCLLQRSTKCDSLLRNRLRGIHHDQQRLDFIALLEEPVNSLEVLATYAEYSDCLRDAIVENYNLGFVREAYTYSEQGLKIAFKMGCYTRAIQMANLSLLAVLDINEDMAPISVEYAKGRLHILSTSSKIEPGSPGRCQSPSRLLQKLQDSFDELVLDSNVPLKRLHDFKKDCLCELCQSFVNNGVFAMDYMQSILLYHGYVDDHIAQMVGQYSTLREKINPEQCQFLGNVKKGQKMKPPQWLCEVYSLASLRWLREMELTGRPYFRDTRRAELRKTILDQVIKFYDYGRQKFLMYYLSCRQLKRHDAVGDCSYLPYTWMKPATDERNDSATGNPNTTIQPTTNMDGAVSEALEDYKFYSHLLYRDWRYPLCTFIARFSKDPWLAAAMWSESTVLTTRAGARLISGKVDSYVFNRSSSFESLVKRLPRDFTVIQIAADENENIFIIKLFSERLPIMIPVAHKSKVQRIRHKMQDLLKNNDASSVIASMTAADFWTNRRLVDAELKSIVKAVQPYLFGSLSPLLLPCQSLTARGKQLAAELVTLAFSENSTFNLNLAEELVSLCSQISSTQWSDLIQALGAFCQLSSEKIILLQKEYTKLLKRVKSKGVINKEAVAYTFLSICPALSVCPLEAMDIFAENPHLGRIVSVHALFRQVMKNSLLPKAVDVSNSFYVLDPDNNLVATQKRMTEFLSKFSMKGIVGGAPSTTEFKSILQEKDILFFLGHGSGSKHLPKKAIKESKCNAVSVLMGCGSVSLEHDGWGLDGKSTAYDYTIANCPAVIGCLWMVTDGEIDRFFMALVKLCFASDSNTTINDGQKRLRSLMESMRKARAQSKLPYLTGAAVISYGLPIISCE